MRPPRVVGRSDQTRPGGVNRRNGAGCGRYLCVIARKPTTSTATQTSAVSATTATSSAGTAALAPCPLDGGARHRALAEDRGGRHTDRDTATTIFHSAAVST